MNNNNLASRISDFFNKYQPFLELSVEELYTISLSVKVISLDKNDTLFKIGDELHNQFYIVASGLMHISLIRDAEEHLIDKPVVGEIFGLRPFFAKNNYATNARAMQDSIIYAIPIAVFKPFLAKDTKILDFLLQNFTSSTADALENLTKGFANEGGNNYEKQNEIQFFQSLAYNKNPLLVQSEETIQNVAQKMTDALMGCAVIHNQKIPLGIVTDADLRSKIATGRFYITALTHKIMSTPVITVPENTSLAEAQLLMLQYNITHLCVTLDGTDKTEIVGVISQQDLIVAQSSNPGVLIKEIKRAPNPEELRLIRTKFEEFIQISIQKKIPLSHINTIAGEVNNALIKRIIDLCILNLGSPPVRFAWFSIGSQGRKEQLLFTDQNSFLVYENVAEEKNKTVKDYFLQLAENVVALLKIIGYPLSVNNYEASHANWCKSVAEWINQFNLCMNFPGEKSNSIPTLFFDYELAYGPFEFEEQLNGAVFKNLENAKKFFAYLGAETLKNPAPLSFFKQFIVEEEGTFKDLFDIKNRAILPLVDAARLLILSHKIKGVNNTFFRFKQLAMTEPKYSEIYLNAAEAFMVLSEIRTKEGLKNNSNGHYISIEELSKTDKEKLKNALLPMKELEEIIKNKFQLTYFM
jgi:CBS domain-containing protein